MDRNQSRESEITIYFKFTVSYLSLTLMQSMNFLKSDNTRFILKVAGIYVVWYILYELWLLPTGLIDRPLSHNIRSEEHTSELQSRGHIVCRLLLEKKKSTYNKSQFTQHN